VNKSSLTSKSVPKDDYWYVVTPLSRANSHIAPAPATPPSAEGSLPVSKPEVEQVLDTGMRRLSRFSVAGSALISLAALRTRPARILLGARPATQIH
jgi:hypothetical protein